MISLSEAQRLLHSHLVTLDPVTEPLDRCLGRVLAEEIVSDLDMPPFNKSAMDGYAVRAGDLEDSTESAPGRLKLVGEVPAGTVPGVQVGRGECAKIFTGAPVPEGGDAVVMVEQTSAEGTEVCFRSRPSVGQHICRQGEDIALGQTVVTEGSVLTPAMLGVMAAVGADRPRVYPVPRVAVVASGNEIVAVDQRPGPGQIRNSNSTSIAAQARLAGAEVIPLGIVGDDPGALRAAIDRGLDADVLVLSGGVSVGEYDFVKGALQEAGVKIIFDKVRMKPGKPAVFGVAGRKRRIFGLPGNPVSSFVGFELFVRPMIRSMQGYRGDDLHNPVVTARLTEAAYNSSGRRAYRPARLAKNSNGGWQAELLTHHGSADLLSMVEANGLVVLPEVVRELPLGSPCEAMLLPRP